MNDVATAEGSRAPRFDVHVHLAGVGTQGSGCWTSPRFRRRPTFLGMRLLFGISGRQMRTTIDQDWTAMLSGYVGASQIDYAVCLGFDGVYDAAGWLDERRSQLIVPLEWVFATCERHSNLLPGPSINPFRRDALDLLEEAIERGAALIKWLPIVQGFDPASPRARPFLERLAETRIPLLIHAGSGEVTFATVDRGVGDLASLRAPLDLGISVICAHTAAPVLYSTQRSEIPRLLEMLEVYPNLWVDNSGLANPSRFPYLPRFADDPGIRERTLHGSDYPVIADAFYYLRRFGVRRVRAIQKIDNPIEREAVIKREMGFDEASFSRAGRVLANLDRWCRTPG